MSKLSIIAGRAYELEKAKYHCEPHAHPTLDIIQWTVNEVKGVRYKHLVKVFHGSSEECDAWIINKAMNVAMLAIKKELEKSKQPSGSCDEEGWEAAKIIQDTCPPSTYIDKWHEGLDTFLTTIGKD